MSHCNLLARFVLGEVRGGSIDPVNISLLIFFI